jgi:NRPS condensation-like uncharacterized protein
MQLLLEWSQIMGEIPKRLPSSIMDRVEAMLVFTVDMMIQLELEFPQKLDIDRLSRAVDLVLDAEPVLGCRWVPHWRRPRWERLNRSERQSFLPVNSQEAYEKFKSESINPNIGPQIKACLWQSTDGDWLLLKVSHIAGDAAAVKDVATAISSIYGRLAHDPAYQPQPNLTGSRDIWQILRYVPWHAYPKIYLNFLREIRTIEKAKHGVYMLPFDDRSRENLEFAYRFLPADRVTYLADYGRSQDATLNDVILAAYSRALELQRGLRGQSKLMVLMTADLRQWYLPAKRAEGICTLSEGEYLNLGTDIGHDFVTRLHRVSNITKRRKANWIGLNTLVGALPLYSMPQSFMERSFRRATQRLIDKHNLMPGFTNMGEIDKDSVTFDKPASSAILLTPPAYPPHFAAGMSGYAGTLTITAGVYRPQRNVVEQFLDAMIAQLPG